MFIRKKVYEEKMDLLEGYIKRCDSKNDQIAKLKSEIIDLKDKNKTLQERMDIIGENHNIVLKENEKLIEWVEKIINEVGCYKVPDGNHVTIPVYKNEDRPAYYGYPYDPFIGGSVVTVVPEIKVVKMS